MSKATTEPMTPCLACEKPQPGDTATLCEHCLAKSIALLNQGSTPEKIAGGRDDIRAVLESWVEAKAKAAKKTESVSRETAVAVLIPIDEIEPNPYQPRKVFSEVELQELADSISEHGVLQPVLVRPNPVDGYQLIAGERRWRASQLAGLTSIEAVVRKVDDQTMAEMALVENAQRHDISVIEQAVAIKRLKDEFNLSVDYIAQRAGISRPVVANRLRLLDLPVSVQERIAKGELSESHGRALAKYKRFPDFVSYFAGHIVEKQLTSKLVESGLYFQLSWMECNEVADDLEERGLLVALDTKQYSFVKDDDLLFEHPDVIVRGSLEKDRTGLLCLDVELAKKLHKQWKQKEKEESKAAAKNSKDEQAKKLAKAMAKAKAGEIILFSDLNFTQYQHIYDHSCPSTCNAQCECRAQAKHTESSEHVYQICLNPERLKELQKAEAESKKEARQAKAAKLTDMIFPVLDERAEVGYVAALLTAVILPVLLLSKFERVDEEDLSSAAQRLGIDFDAELFANRDTSDAQRLDLLYAVLDLPRFAIEIMLRDELNKVAEYDWGTPDSTEWLLGVLGVNNED